MEAAASHTCIAILPAPSSSLHQWYACCRHAGTVIVRRPPGMKLYEEGILLALQHRDRVRRIGLRMSI